jgi:ATP-dependent DNA ligase
MFPKVNPMIPVRRPDIFDSSDCVYEVKYDGFRALAYVGEGSQPRRSSRRAAEEVRVRDQSENRQANRPDDSPNVLARADKVSK